MADTFVVSQQRVQSIAQEHGLVLNPFPKKTRVVVDLMAKN